MNKIDLDDGYFVAPALNHTTRSVVFEPPHDLKRLADELYKPLTDKNVFLFASKPHPIDITLSLDRWVNEGGSLRAV